MRVVSRTLIGVVVLAEGLIEKLDPLERQEVKINESRDYQELFPWLQALYPVWAGLTPEGIRLGTRLALTELLMSGCTMPLLKRRSQLPSSVVPGCGRAAAVGLGRAASRGRGCAHLVASSAEEE